MLKKKRGVRPTPDIPLASQADIAFLLLCFFLVVTTFDTDTGIYMELPPPLDENVTPPEIPSRNLMNVLVNAEGQVLIDSDYVQISDIRPLVVRFVTNFGRVEGLSDSPQDAIVSFKTERRAAYEMYLSVLDEIKMAYLEIRNNEARSRFGVTDYATYRSLLGEDEEDQIREDYPQRISIAEPDPGE